MEYQRIRYFVILASLIIFCYQLNTALHHLMNVETVDLTEYIPISELDPPPVITLCPRIWGNSKILTNYGYKDMSALIKGKNRQIGAIQSNHCKSN